MLVTRFSARPSASISILGIGEIGFGHLNRRPADRDLRPLGSIIDKRSDKRNSPHSEIGHLQASPICPKSPRTRHAFPNNLLSLASFFANCADVFYFRVGITAGNRP
jgi:hypothetical protein